MRALVVLSLLLAACGPDPGGDDSSGVDAAHPDARSGPDSMIVDQSEVYAHSGSELYRIDTNNLSVLDIGPFGSALTGSMTDIAIDKNGVMLGVSLSKIFSIDPQTGTATELALFNGGAENLTSLSFVPEDASDPQSAERLITAGDQGGVYEVDQVTGDTTLLGNYGTFNNNQIRSSGDIVSVRGFGTIATVDAGPNLTDPDYLATIDPLTWEATPIGTASTGFDRIFGLAFWGGTIFGFVDNRTDGTGGLVTIDPDTGVATAVNVEQFEWYGAGVTTIAPIVN